MAVDSGTYDDATLQRRYAMAQALMQNKQPIRNWAEGLSGLAESALGGYQISKLDAEHKAEKASEKSDLYKAFGRPVPETPPAPSEGGFQRLAAILNGGGASPSAPPAAAPMGAPAGIGPTDASPLDNAAWPAGPVGAPARPAPVRVASLDASSVPAPGAPPRTPVEPIPDITRTNPDGTIAGNVTAPTIPTPAGTKIAQALDAPAAPSSGGILAGIPDNKKDAILAALTSSNPTLKALGVSAVTNLTKQDDPISVGGKLVSKSGKVIYDGGDDKTPAGFRKTDGGLEPIPGGPADLAYLRLKAAKEKDPNGNYVLGRGGEVVKNNPDGSITVLHKNQEEGGEPLTDDAIDFAAKRAIAADPKALTNLGRGQQGRADLAKINNRIGEMMRGDPNGAKTIMDNAAKQAGLVSSSRALGTKETHFGVAEKAMEESIPVAQAASDALPRSDWVHFNKLVQGGQTEHSNPLLRRALIATDTAAKDYARTINPTGALRESDIEYARKIISVADGPEAYRAALDQLRIEAGVMHRAIQRQKKELHGGASAPEAVATPAPAQTSTVDPAALAEAKRRGLIP